MDKIREQKCLDALEKVLSSKYPHTYYCLTGYQESSVCLQVCEGGWEVYCGERNKHFESVVYDSIYEASLAVLKKIGLDASSRLIDEFFDIISGISVA